MAEAGNPLAGTDNIRSSPTGIAKGAAGAVLNRHKSGSWVVAVKPALDEMARVHRDTDRQACRPAFGPQQALHYAVDELDIARGVRPGRIVPEYGYLTRIAYVHEEHVLMADIVLCERSCPTVLVILDRYVDERAVGE